MLKDADGNDVECFTFDEMGLEDTLLRGIYGYGIEKPSPFQRSFIPTFLHTPNDIIAFARSGTGKTLAYSIAILQRVQGGSRRCQAIVVAPTRELGHGIERVVARVGEYRGVRTGLCIGGMPAREAEESVREKEVVVGTPGRLVEFMERGLVDGRELKALVMDEVDEMVARGFKELLHRICGFLPGGVQKVVLGSGMDEECKEVVGRLLADPVEVRVVEVKGRSVEEGRHFFVDCEREEWKLECLVDLLGFLEDKKVIVFCNTRRRVGWLENELVLRNLLVLSVHGDMDVSQRDIVLKRFKKGSGEKSCLICTDLLSVGIPGSDKDVIIHYDISRNCESYARRVCRGSQGNFISVVLIAQEQQQLRDIETYYNIKCEELPSNMDL